MINKYDYDIINYELIWFLCVHILKFRGQTIVGAFANKIPLGVFCI